MAAQYLTLPDGTLPPGVNVAALTAAGVLLVRPTAPPTPGQGQTVRDTADPTTDGEGGWLQRWEVVADETPPVRKIPPLDFMNRLPFAVQVAIVAAGESSPAARLWFLRLSASPLVELDAIETRGAVASLVAAGVLTQGQADALLA